MQILINFSIPSNIFFFFFFFFFFFAEYSAIRDFSIPSNINKICKGAFSHCENLSQVEIPINSKLQIFDKKAFEYTSIKSI